MARVLSRVLAGSREYALGVAGFALVSTGVGAIYWPAGLIVAGVLLTALDVVSE